MNSCARQYVRMIVLNKTNRIIKEKIIYKRKGNEKKKPDHFLKPKQIVRKQKKYKLKY